MINIGVTLHSRCLTSITVRCSRKWVMSVTYCEISSRTNDKLPAAGDVCAFLLCLRCYCEYHASFCTKTLLSNVWHGCWPASGKCLLNANSANQTGLELQIALLCKALLHTNALQTHVRHQHAKELFDHITWIVDGCWVNVFRPTLANNCLKSKFVHHLSFHHKSRTLRANIKCQTTQCNYNKQIVLDLNTKTA